MPRIAGVDIPRDKQIWVSLQYIHGIGSALSHKALDYAGVNAETKADDLTEEEVNRLREYITGSTGSRVNLKKKSASTSSVSLRLAVTGVTGTATACRSGDSGPAPMLVLTAVRERLWPVEVRSVVPPRSNWNIQ